MPHFGNLGFTEILLLLVVVLLLFGAKRLPEIGSSMGKGIREFKRSFSDVDKAIREPEPPARLDQDYGSSERLPTTDTVAEDATREPKRLIG